MARDDASSLTRKSSACPREGGRGELAGRWDPLGTALLAFLGLLPLIGLGAFAFHEPDEGRYADIAAWMVRHGEWLSPHLNGLAYFEKPPFFFWLAALSMKLFGINEWAARLPSVLAALATLLVVERWGRRVIGRRGGLWAALLLASTPLFALLSRVVLVDATLVCFTTCALYFGSRGLIEPAASDGPRRRWILLFWCACGLATWVKGPVGCVLPLSSVGAALLVGGRKRWLGALLRLDGLLLFLGLVVPYYLVLARANPGYLYEFVIEQNLQRFTTGGRFGRDRPIWYYLPVLLVAFLPWGLVLPVRARHLWRDARQIDAVRGRLLRYLLCSLVAPFVVLSLAQSKLPYYILPLAPPLALILADRLASGRASTGVSGQSASRVVWIGSGTGMVVALFLGGGAVLACGAESETLLALIGRTPEEAFGCVDSLRAVALRGGVTLILLGGVLGVATDLLRRGRGRAGSGFLAAGLVAFFAALPWVAAAAGPLYSVRALARVVQNHSSGHEVLLTYERFLRGLPFYLGRPTMLWSASHAEFGRGLTADEAQGRSLQRSLDALERLVRGGRSVLVVATKEKYRRRLIDLAGDALLVVDRLGPYTLFRTRSP